MEDKITIQSPQGWNDYELIDSGNYEKLERFGTYLVARPEPQAVWDRSLPEAEWVERADAYFRRDKNARAGEERGQWTCRRGMPERWWVEYRNGGVNFRMRLGLTSFKHVGLFPEQAANWHFVEEQLGRIAPLLGGEGGAQGGIRESGVSREGGQAEVKDGVRENGDAEHIERPRVLNLFAYTGGATLAARCAGAEVTHVDSVKPVVNWARENMEASSLDGVRWMVEDALKFVRREVKRGRTYHGILLDPPAYGRGPEGERWILEENLNEMLSLCGQLLEKQHSFLVLNLYSMGMSPLLARTALRQAVGFASGEQMGELCFADSFGKLLPLGVYSRLWRD